MSCTFTVVSLDESVAIKERETALYQREREKFVRAQRVRQISGRAAGHAAVGGWQVEVQCI